MFNFSKFLVSSKKPALKIEKMLISSFILKTKLRTSKPSTPHVDTFSYYKSVLNDKVSSDLLIFHSKLFSGSVCPNGVIVFFLNKINNSSCAINISCLFKNCKSFVRLSTLKMFSLTDCFLSKFTFWLNLQTIPGNHVFHTVVAFHFPHCYYN